MGNELMTRVEIAKMVMKEDFQEHGIFFVRNWCGDPMTVLYNDGEMRVEACFQYDYFEIFGLTNKEEEELEEWYYDYRKEL